MNLKAVLMLALGLGVFGAAGRAQSAVPGGRVPVALPNQNCAAAARFAVEAQGKAPEKKKGAAEGKLELVKLLAAEEQVVAGMSYRLKLKVKIGGQEKEAEAEVWWQAWRKPDPYRLTKWTWK